MGSLMGNPTDVAATGCGDITNHDANVKNI
jgi:hypothetical protein